MKKLNCLAGFMFIMLGTFFCVQQAHALVWQPSTGPGGGIISFVEVDPVNANIIYAGTGHGLYKSMDSGNSWLKSDIGVFNYGSANALAIDPNNSSVLYLSLDSNDFYKSIDGGNTWVSAQVGLPSGISWPANVDIVVDPNNSNIVYISSQSSGTYKSTSAGANWIQIDTMPALTIAVSSVVASNTLYIGGTGLKKSTDGGATWVTLAAPGSAAYMYGNTQLTIDPLNQNILYLTSGNDIFKSIDAGVNWTNLTSLIIGQTIGAFVLDPSVPSTMYFVAFTNQSASIYKSVNAGLSWISMPTGLTFYYQNYLSINHQSPNVLYLGTHGPGLFKSVDSGVSWSDANKGIGDVQMISLTVAKSNPNILYAGTQPITAQTGGIFKSVDKGANWSKLGLTDASVNAIAVDPQNANIVYAGTGINCPVGINTSVLCGVLKSVDAGVTWLPMNNGMGDQAIRDIAIDPTTPSTLYVATDIAAFKSVDGGNNWTILNTGTFINTKVYSVSIDPIISSTVYLGVVGVVLKSTDSGVTWSSTSLPAFSAFEVIVIDPVNTKIMYALTWNGGVLYKSIDGGATWISLANTPQYTRSLIIDPVSTNILYASAKQGIYQSTDFGDTWFALNAGLDTIQSGGLNFSTLAIDPINNTRIYAAGWSFGGVYIGDATPIGSMSVNNGSALTNATNVTLNITCNHNIGCAQMQFSNDGNTWGALVNVAPTAAWSLPANSVGVTTVYARFTDASGSASSVVSDTITLDTLAPSVPVITSPISDTYAQNSARPTISGTAEVDSSVNVKDGAILLGLVTATGGNWSLASGTAVLSEGQHSFTAIATDAAGNSSASTSPVLYTVDTTAPVVVLNGNADIYVEAGAMYVEAGARWSDAVDGSGNLVAVGWVNNNAVATYSLTYDYTDTAGNAGIQVERRVHVQDTTSPLFQGIPLADIVVQATGLNTSVTLVAPSSTDVFAVTVSSDAPVTFLVGTTVVTWSATDVNGNSSTASQNVIVQDNAAPVIQGAPLADIIVKAAGQNTLVTLTTPTFTDSFAVTVSTNAPTTFPMGTTVVTWTATDANGNSSTASQHVIVKDSIAPVIQGVPLADIAVQATGVNTKVTLASPTATDLFAVSVVSDAPTTFPMGTTVVTWTATDSNGNSSIASQNVIVQNSSEPASQGSSPTDASAQNDGSAGGCLAPISTVQAPVLFPMFMMMLLGLVVVRHKAK